MGTLDPTLPLAAVSTWLYVGICVALPLAWGIGTELVFRWLRRRRTRHGESPSPDDWRFTDYQI